MNVDELLLRAALDVRNACEWDDMSASDSWNTDHATSILRIALAPLIAAATAIEVAEANRMGIVPLGEKDSPQWQAVWCDDDGESHDGVGATIREAVQAAVKQEST